MDGTLIKADKDYTEKLDKELPEIDKLVTQKNVPAALEKLFVLEKQTRLASDLASSKRVLSTIINVYKTTGDWSGMNEQIQVLTKKHGQMKQAIAALIQDVVNILDQAPNLEIKIKTIETIRTVTEGKIYVEVERARVSRILCEIKESQGDIEGAAEVLGELQVETYTGMDIREKMEFILEQVDLYIRKGDFTQASIVSRKITPKHLEKKEYEDLKLKYYELMIKITVHDSEFLQACQNYRAIYDMPKIADSEDHWKPVLEKIVYFIILAPYDNLVNDLIHKIAADPHLEFLPIHKQLLQCFIADELMRWPKMEEFYGPALSKTSVFNQKTDDGKTRWDELRKRVIEHNVRVISKYYKRIRMSRLTSLLDLNDKETEQFLSKLVTQGTIYARFNRPDQLVSFCRPKTTNDILNDWSSDIGDLLQHVETIGHLITKDEMMNSLVK